MNIFDKIGDVFNAVGKKTGLIKPDITNELTADWLNQIEQYAAQDVSKNYLPNAILLAGFIYIVMKKL